MSYTVRQNPAAPSNFTQGRLGNTINSIVMHHAATTDFDGIGRTFRGGAGTSAHYGVGMNGNVDQYVQEGDIAYHAGNWARNQVSIGIEHVNQTGAPTWGINPQTIQTSIELVRDIATRHNLLPLKVGVNFFGHKDVSLLGTACPMNLEPQLQAIADAVNNGKSVGAAHVVVAANNTPDQILEIGSVVRFDGTYTVNALAQIGSIWQLQSNDLCRSGFTWVDNGIPTDPVTEVAGGAGNPNDQVLQVGSKFKIPGTYKVVNMGMYAGRWLAQISMGGWRLWVDVEPLTEVANG